MAKLLQETLTTNASTTALPVNFIDGMVVVTGTFDSATATLEVSADAGTTYVAVGTNTTLTAAGAGRFQIDKDTLDPYLIRVTTSGGGGSLDVDITISKKDA